MWNISILWNLPPPFTFYSYPHLDLSSKTINHCYQHAMVFNGCQLLVEQYDGDSRLLVKLWWNEIVFSYICYDTESVCAATESHPNMIQSQSVRTISQYKQICFTIQPNIFFSLMIKSASLNRQTWFFLRRNNKSLCKNASNTFVICRLWNPNCNVYICTQSCWCCTLYILRYTLYSSCTQCILAFHSDLLADDNVTFVCSFL